MSQPESPRREAVPALDAILGKRFDLGSDGFVRVVDYMGSDAAIVQAARISYGRGTKKSLEDRGLIRYLLRHRHTSPFEMCELKLHLRVPMDAWRQWIRHRTASVNEYSTRYSVAIAEAQVTPPDQWRLQATGNKQGSEGLADEIAGAELTRREAELQALAREVYEERLEQGVAREQARKDLPLSTYTEVYWKIDLHNLLHFLALRMDAHAQQEIREYATLIGEEIVSRWCPFAWEAFRDYRLEALALTRIEAEVIAALGAGDSAAAEAVLKEAGMLEAGKKGLRRNRERQELEEKLGRLGMACPWKEDRAQAKEAP